MLTEEETYRLNTFRRIYLPEALRTVTCTERLSVQHELAAISVFMLDLIDRLAPAEKEGYMVFEETRITEICARQCGAPEYCRRNASAMGEPWPCENCRRFYEQKMAHALLG